MGTKHVVVKVGPSGRGTVEIDGEAVVNCRGVVVASHINEATTVTLDLVNVSVDVEVDVEDDHILSEVTHVGSQNREYRKVT